MSRIFNFSAGPCTLPLSALESAAAEFVDYQGAGMSLIEMSHRSKEYDAVHEEALALFRELLNVPESHKILFIGGGATLQFTMLAMNFLHGGKSCDFTLTGSWAKKAYADAKKIGNVNVLYDGKDASYLELPDPSTLKVNADAEFLHMTSNETIGGIEWHSWPETGDVPLICDMSSDIMSREIPVEKFGMIYAGAQKNLGPAGVGIVIIRDDMLEKCPDELPAFLNYKTHADANSLYHTPPVFCIYMIGKVLAWVKEQGGLPAMDKLAQERSDIIYQAIENSDGYYRSPVPAASRSRMNIVWRLPSEDLEKKFIAEADGKGFSGLKGHRSVGGCRASVYNAMPVEGVQALSDFMNAFQSNNA
jgi:phosphoserine aminotransferase